MKNAIKAFFSKDWSCEEKVLLVSAVTLAGILLGFLLCPKRSQHICCGNHNYEGPCDCEDEEEEI